jgi:hypothetical protein
LAVYYTFWIELGHTGDLDCILAGVEVDHFLRCLLKCCMLSVMGV